MNTKQKEVLRKIIYAVETGGQVYGKQDYSDFTEAYTNSSTEHAITIGAGQWFATEAQTLLKRIYQASKSQWQKLDSVGLLEDVLHADWSCYNIVKSSQKAKCIVALISTPVGIKCQDTLMDEQMEVYVKEAAALDVTEPDAQAMCANFRHQGGASAVTRILKKTSRPYTLDRLYDACQTDTGNQVGAYKARQKFVYNTLRKYFPKEDAKMSKTEKAIQQMENWAQDDSHGYDQIYRWGEKGDYDCSAAVIQAWENAGVPVKSNGATYTGNMLNVFKKCGFADVTSKINLATGVGLKRGDVLLNTAHHTAMHCGNGKEVEASINEKGTATGGKPGDQTGKEFLIRSYRNYPWNYVLRYQEGTASSGTASTTKTAASLTSNITAQFPQIQKGCTGVAVSMLQTMLGVTADGDFGANTQNALKTFQKNVKLTQDGVCGANTWKAIVEHMKANTYK